MKKSEKKKTIKLIYKVELGFILSHDVYLVYIVLFFFKYSKIVLVAFDQCNDCMCKSGVETIVSGVVDWLICTVLLQYQHQKLK